MLFRYATGDIRNIWSRRYATHQRQTMWVGVAQVQQRLGLSIPDYALDDYRSVITRYSDYRDYAEKYDCREDAQLEKTGHETVAALRTFEHSAGDHGKLHLGMTSSDISENLTQKQIRASVDQLWYDVQALAGLMRDVRSQWLRDGSSISGRTHNVPAQPVAPAQRFNRAIDGIAWAHAQLGNAIDAWPQRGLSGAVGNNADMRALGLGTSDIDRINQEVFGGRQTPCGAQNYPRAWDLPVLTAVLGLVAPVADLALTLRLMAGHGLVAETRYVGQVGSSAMAHKTNPILAERIHGLQIVARGYHSMVVQTCGERWNEGDISDSCVRRVALPGLFGAVSGVLRTAAEMVTRIEPDWREAKAELEADLPQLITGRLLSLCITRGVNRNAAHTEIARLCRAGVTLPGFAHEVNSSTLPIDGDDVNRIAQEILRGDV